MKGSFNEKAKEIVEKLTLEEKCGLLVYDSKGVERMSIPDYNWWNESLHGLARGGTATMFPQAIGLAATFDCQLMQNVGNVIGTEARAKYNESSKRSDFDIYKGLTLWSPNINIFRDPRWGRGHETYGEDPYLTSRLGVSFVSGIQENDGTYMKAAACAKHFAVHSGPEELRHGFNAEVSKIDLAETYLPAFEALVTEAGVEGVMGAYNRLNGQPCCASEFLRSTLYDKWNFDGYFVSDFCAIDDFHEFHNVTASKTESAAMAINVECDLIAGNKTGCDDILDAYRKGLISEETINRAAFKVLRTRLRLGMGAKTSYDDIGLESVDSPQSNQLSYEAAVKSAVLLKNDGILPIDKNKIKSLAVIGPNADSRAVLKGNYTGTASGYTTFLDGIKSAYDGRIYYSEGSHLFMDKIEPFAHNDDRISEAVAAAEHSDMILLFVGLDASLEGEQGDTGNPYASGDKENLMLPPCQQRLLKAMEKTGKPLVIILSSGSSVNPMSSKASAVLQTWYCGSHGGKALADIIFGKVSPSGKLPVTFYESTELLPDFSDYSMKNRTYKYAENNVLYPFGFGLTYSEFKAKELSVNYNDNGLEAKIEFENIGGRYSENVAQLYIRCSSKYFPLNGRLCGFRRFSAESGESVTVTIQIDYESFLSVNENGERFLDKDAEFELFAGVSQPDTLSMKLGGEKCLSVKVKPGKMYKMHKNA